MIKGSSKDYTAGDIRYMANKDVVLQTLDAFDGALQLDQTVFGILYGKEKEDSYRFTTASGKEIVVSSAHPLVTGDSNGKLKAMKAAKTIEVGEFLVNDLGEAEEIVAVATFKYEGDMVNFHIDSSDWQEKVVSANGILAGENSWQQKLASIERRILARDDIISELR